MVAWWLLALPAVFSWSVAAVLVVLCVVCDVCGQEVASRTVVVSAR